MTLCGRAGYGEKVTINDTESAAARFGCGFVFGLWFGALGLLGSAYALGLTEMFLVLGVATAFGLAAMKFADRCLRWVGRWLP